MMQKHAPRYFIRSALFLSLMISKQRVFQQVLPPLTEEAPLFVF